MRRTLALLAIAALTLPTLAAITNAAPTGQDKMSPELQAAVNGDATHAEPDGRLRVLVLGAPLAPPAQAPDSRAAWDAYWQDASSGLVTELGAFARANGGSVVGAWPAAPSVEMLLSPQAALSLASMSAVKGMGLDYRGAIHLTDATTTGPGALSFDSVAAIGAPTFWNAGFRGEGVHLAVLDTGIDATHPMLLDALNGCGSRVVAWKDYVSGQTTPYDDHGHGTHVSGTAAGTTQCGGQLNGVAPHAILMGAKILDSSGSGAWQNAQSALQWAFDHGADVTSNSYGGGDSVDSEAVAQLVNQLAKGGMLSAIAAGNNGPGASTITWPGQADLALTVGAVDSLDNVASFSSRGPCADGRTCPDVVAPGVDITSSWPGGGTASLSGTSMATPHVTGSIALSYQAIRAMLQREPLRPGDPGIVKSEIEDLLTGTATDLGTLGPDNAYGWGLVNLDAAYHTLLSRATANVVLSSAVSAAHVRRGESTSVSFTLRNLGGQDASGHALAALTGPAGLEATLEDDTLVVAAGATVARAWTLAGDSLPTGDHVATLTYTYDARDPTTNVTRSVTTIAAVAFRVERAEIALVKAVPTNASLAMPFNVTVTLRNVGNLPATSVQLAELVPGAYALVPRAPRGLDANGAWSSPAPTSKTTRLDLSTQMQYDVSASMDPGASWSVAYALAPLGQGAFALPSHASFGDDGRVNVTVDAAPTQVVTLTP